MRTKNSLHVLCVCVGMLLVLLPAGLPSVSGSQPAGDEEWEFKAAHFGGEEQENARMLAALATEHWEYVGPLGNNLAAFKRKLNLEFNLVRRIEWPGNHIFHTAISPDGKLYLGGGDTGTFASGTPPPATRCWSCR